MEKGKLRIRMPADLKEGDAMLVGSYVGAKLRELAEIGAELPLEAELCVSAPRDSLSIRLTINHLSMRKKIEKKD